MPSEPGVLVVSETAGVAADAADSALLISPLDVEGTARAMADALDMPVAERRRGTRGFATRDQLDSARLAERAAAGPRRRASL